MTITRRTIAENKRLAFLPSKLPTSFLDFENAVYSIARSHAEEYTGGYWQFYELSNGGFYMGLEGAEPIAIDIASNGFSSTEDADTYSIIICLFAFSELSALYYDRGNPEYEQLATYYHVLRDYVARCHQHANSIFAAID